MNFEMLIVSKSLHCLKLTMTVKGTLKATAVDIKQKNKQTNKQTEETIKLNAVTPEKNWRLRMAAKINQLKKQLVCISG